MLRAGSFEDSLAYRRKLTLPNGAGYWKSEFITSAEAALAPQAFLIEQDPDSTIDVHFHFENEFQVVVQGKGAFGRRPVRPISVHYAAGHTGYGPITAGADGLWYFTLRPRVESGAHFLPEARSKMKRLPKRAALANPLDTSTSEALRARRETAVEPLIAPAQDGLAAWAVRIGPHDVAHAPSHAGGEGRFYLVAAGSLLLPDRQLGRLGIVFESDESGLTLRAGDTGLEIIVMQLPAAQVPP